MIEKRAINDVQQNHRNQFNVLSKSTVTRINSIFNIVLAIKNEPWGTTYSNHQSPTEILYS